MKLLFGANNAENSRSFMPEYTHTESKTHICMYVYVYVMKQLQFHYITRFVALFN